MIVGLGGNNGTTVVAGCIANREVRFRVCLCVLAETSRPWFAWPLSSLHISFLVLVMRSLLWILVFDLVSQAKGYMDFGYSSTLAVAILDQKHAEIASA